MILQEMKLETRHSFLDYITTGLEISLIVAIDFTRSNKDVNKKESMHHYDVSTANEYVLAIRAVGEILQHYDSDDRSPGCSTVCVGSSSTDSRLASRNSGARLSSR